MCIFGEGQTKSCTSPKLNTRTGDFISLDFRRPIELQKITLQFRKGAPAMIADLTISYR